MEKKAKPALPETTVAPKVVPFESSQKVLLTDEELQSKGAELADAIDEQKRAEAELNEVKQQFKSRIDGAVCKAAGLASTIRAKSEYRTVKCERRFEFELGLVVERRCDTWERINERPMTDQDRQQHLPLDK